MQGTPTGMLGPLRKSLSWKEQPHRQLRQHLAPQGPAKSHAPTRDTSAAGEHELHAVRLYLQHSGSKPCVCHASVTSSVTPSSACRARTP